MSKKPAPKLAAEDNDFQTAPAPVKSEPRKILYVPQPPAPQIEKSEPAAQIPEVSLPSDLATAFRELKAMQARVSAMPGASRHEQRARWAAEQALEKLRQHVHDMQQGPTAPDQTAIGMHPCTKPAAPAAVARMRELISDRLN